MASWSPWLGRQRRDSFDRSLALRLASCLRSDPILQRSVHYEIVSRLVLSCCETPAAPGVTARTLAWGREHVTRAITTTGKLTDSKVAAYVAKYATKAAECTGTLDRRVTPAYRLAE